MARVLALIVAWIVVSIPAALIAGVALKIWKEVSDKFPKD